MSEFIENFSTLITTDRAWSWSFIGILYVILTLIVRSWFLRPLEVNIKELKRRWYKEVKDSYSKHSVAGWVFYLISFIIVLFIWSRPQLVPLKPAYAIGLLIALSSFILSICLHIQALGIACADTLRRMESKL